MSAATNVPIEYYRAKHLVETTEQRDLRLFPLRSGKDARCSGRSACHDYTLLELVEAITEVTDDDREVVATVLHMMASGRVRLCGNFRDEPIEAFGIESVEVAIPG
ncbi:MAG: hypothetical protein JRE70_04475 [Deltaproteobacteria bacterium]|nr:hypothetical protein [Deltaproteobacteria bacterium]